MLTVQELAGFRKQPNWETDLALLVAVEATNAYVDSLPTIDREIDGSWAKSTQQAALILASRFYLRQATPTGITAYGQDQSVFVTKYDSDIARLLHIDGFQEPYFA